MLSIILYIHSIYSCTCNLLPKLPLLYILNFIYIHDTFMYSLNSVLSFQNCKFPKTFFFRCRRLVFLYFLTLIKRVNCFGFLCISSGTHNMSYKSSTNTSFSPIIYTFTLFVFFLLPFLAFIHFSFFYSFLISFWKFIL